MFFHQVNQNLPPTLLQTDETRGTEQQHIILETNIRLSQIELIELENSINPLRPSSHNGVDLYLEVLQFVHSRLTCNPENN